MKTNREMLKTLCIGIVTIFIFYSSYWLKGNIGRVDKIEAAKSEYTSSLYCIEKKYNRNFEYLKEADTLEKKINTGTYNGNINEAQSKIAKKRDLAPVLVRSSKRCIEEAEEYEKEHNIKIPDDKIKLREKIRNTK